MGFNRRPQSRYTVSRIECRIKFPQNQGCRTKIALHPPKSRCRTFLWTLAAQESHRKIAVTTVAASGLATIPLQKSQGFSLRRPQKNRQPLAILGVSLKIAATTAASCRSRAISRPQRPRDTKLWTPLSHFPLICSRQGAKGGGVQRAGGGCRSTFGFRKRIALQGGCRSYSHTSRATLCN